MGSAVALESKDFVSGAGFTAVLLLVGVLVRQFVPWRKLRVDAEAQLRTDLLERVSRLENALDTERANRERERVKHEAERRLDRHRLNNVTTCFDALLLLIEMDPARAQEAVKRVKEMRAAQMIAEAEEKAIIMAAELNQHTAPGVTEDE